MNSVPGIENQAASHKVLIEPQLKPSPGFSEECPIKGLFYDQASHTAHNN